MIIKKNHKLFLIISYLFQSKMSKIIVNATLFVTCRLCLEDLGVYQIVPEVKEQILYCFGINVSMEIIIFTFIMFHLRLKVSNPVFTNIYLLC